MKFNPDANYVVWGDPQYRDKKAGRKCMKEDPVHVAFVAWVRYNYPEVAELLFHINNEGMRTPQQIAKAKAMGDMNTGAPDIMVVGSPLLCMELKREDRTLSHWQPEQEPWLERAYQSGAYTCVALGLQAAKDAFIHWLELQPK